MIRNIATAAILLFTTAANAQFAVHAERLHTVTNGTINNATVLIDDGIITAVGPTDSIEVPDEYQHLHAPVVTPGLIDARTTAGLTGILNARGQAHDQDMLETSEPIQPALRAIDAYNPREELVTYLRSFGITTIHTGHAPGELVSGQTLIAKTRPTTIDDAVINPFRAVAATLDPAALKPGTDSPGTRAKAVSMLRDALIDAREYSEKVNAARLDANTDPPPRNLTHEALAAVLAGEKPLIITANRAQDIASAMRLAEEFGFTLWLDSAAEAYTLTDEIRHADHPVILHPTMARHVGTTQNASFTTAAKLADAGITVAIQSGYESYVPKVRVILFEAAIAAAYNLGQERALEAITITPARLLGIDNIVGSIEPGKHADLALYSGDPFEYTTQCLGTIIEGQIVSHGERPNERDTQNHNTNTDPAANEP